jgi:colanic acid/amylovoran biosynthesis glycosyltransferase
MTGTIAYIMSRFPHLPETFILREMNELERLGRPVALYPLIRQRQSVVHADARAWLARARYTPHLSRGVLSTNARMAAGRPGAYLRAWGRALRENAAHPGFLARTLLVLPQATAMARQMAADGIVHIHAHYATHPALAAWLIHRLTGISYSITVHAHDIYVRTEMLGPKVHEATFVVAISEYNRQLVARLVGDGALAKTHVIHCGVAPEDYSVAPDIEARPPGGRFELMSVGSLQPYKGHRYLIAACAMLRDRGVPVHCRIIGEGAERPDLEARIRQARLDGVVDLLGARPQEDVARLLPTAHCYVQPSVITPSGKMEGIPVSLMEALACRLPVVATDISGVPELVRPGETGYLVPPRDAAALADRLAEVYAQPAQAARLAEAGRQLVVREFNLHTNVAALASLFATVVA